MPRLNLVNVQAEIEPRGGRFFRAGKKSANRLFDGAVVRRLGQLSRLFRLERQGKLRQGDLLVELIDHHGCRPIDIARAIRHRANELSQMYWVAKTFPPATRPSDTTYNHMLMAMRVTRRFRQANLQPMSVLRVIGQQGFTQHRQVTAFFAARMRQQENLRALQESGPAMPNSRFNRCYHARFQTLLDVFPDRSIKILNADAPYANYRRLTDGRYSGGPLIAVEADSATAAEAIAATVDLLRDWQPKLAPGGVLLLWQASGPLRKPIVEALEQYDWELEAVVIWDKGNIQPGNFELPYSTQSEWLWVLKRRGDHLINHDNSPRGDILRFKSPHPLNEARRHGFEKPENILSYLISKHSFQGELVFDPFGCTASFCAAARNLGRRWVYCESHRGNYQIGASRMAKLVPETGLRAG